MRWAQLSSDGSVVVNVVEAEQSFVDAAPETFELVADGTPVSPGWLRVKEGLYTEPTKGVGELVEAKLKALDILTRAELAVKGASDGSLKLALSQAGTVEAVEEVLAELAGLGAM